jgi:YD repeat-containing protein
MGVLGSPKLYRESLPYFSTGTASTTATSTAALFATTVYDPLYRVTGVGTAVGSTTNAYDDWTTTVTDPNGNVKSLYSDAYGNLNRVDEVNDASTYTTTYEYNYLKTLTKITDALSNIRNFTYDGLGRRLTAEDLHASGDGTFGTWTYTYDDAGNLATSIDPKNQTIEYTYDDSNRVVPQ